MIPPISTLSSPITPNAPSGNLGEEEKDPPTIEYLSSTILEKQRFGKVVWPAQRIEGGKACTLLRRSANPHFVRLSSSSSSSPVVVVGSSGSSATARSSSARGPLPPPPSDPVSPPQASVKARLRPEQPWRARTEPSHGAVPRLRTIDSHGNEPRSRSRVGEEGRWRR